MKVGIIKEDLAFPAPQTFWEKHAWHKAAKKNLKSQTGIRIFMERSLGKVS